ncbi:Mss4-like protein [Aspergillus granulosus]|uniref:Translationally-controlled tumor protein homolog n=1 Tax=Aspergillus granulosus TaxID=176169 RepID=A0ABR4GZ66_9EURO
MTTVYREDGISGDELFSDDFPITEIDGIVYEVKCETIKFNACMEVDVGANNKSDGDIEDIAQTVINVIQSIHFDKTLFFTYLKGYVRAVRTHVRGIESDRGPEFETGPQKFAGQLMDHFKDLEFYTGESMNLNGMVTVLDFRADGTTPLLTF